MKSVTEIFECFQFKPMSNSNETPQMNAKV